MQSVSFAQRSELATPVPSVRARDPGSLAGVQRAVSLAQRRNSGPSQGPKLRLGICRAQLNGGTQSASRAQRSELALRSEPGTPAARSPDCRSRTQVQPEWLRARCVYYSVSPPPPQEVGGGGGGQHNNPPKRGRGGGSGSTGTASSALLPPASLTCRFPLPQPPLSGGSIQLDVLKRPEDHQGKVEAACLAQPAVVGLTHPCPCPDGGESGGDLCGSLLGPSSAEGRS